MTKIKHSNASSKKFRDYGLWALLISLTFSLFVSASEPAGQFSEAQFDEEQSEEVDEETTPTVVPVIKEEKKEDLKKPVILEDLAYGNILFDYYRGESIEALNSILVAEKRNLLPNHAQSARLLSGVIYLDLGMLSHAQGIFNALLTEEDLQSGLLSKIEFYLGKLHYRQGDYQQAEFRLSRIVSSVEQSLRDDCLIMLSNIAIYADQKDKARNWLSQVSGDSKLAAMSRFNLGILWLREDNLTEATQQLDNIHPGFTEDKVIRSLQDKALVALGYYHLSHKKFEKAREYLLKVRLDSPLANKALLGVGWSYSETGRHHRALAHWLELSKRDIRDVAVQEALLAVPFAYQQLSSMQLSLTKYAEASTVFQQQLDLINELMTKIEEGGLLEQFVSNIVTNQYEAIGDDSGIKDSKLFGDQYDYYLYELVSQHQFNEGFRSYQKLGKLAQILTHWEEALPTFSDILQANEIRFSEKIPVVDRYLQEGAFNEYQQMLTDFQADVKALKNNEKLHLLADKNELKLHQRIVRLFEKIERIPPEMLSPEQVLKAKRAKGVFQWQLETGKAGKIWQLEKVAIQIQRILKQMQKRKISLASARQKASTRFSGYQEKVDVATGRLFGLRDKIKFQIDIQALELKEQIIAVLQKRQATLNHYLLQSDLSIARLHEQAVKIPELE